jgi:dUTP pyrophosphatase
MNQPLTFFRSGQAVEKNVTLGIPREGDAGFDLPSLEEVVIPPHSKLLLSTGLHLAIPLGWVGLIRDRSSVASKKGGAVTAGVIDAGYRGEVKVLMHNLTSEPIHFSTGDKIAQCLVIPHLPGTASLEVSSVDDLGTTERGEGGFGSTGK